MTLCSYWLALLHGEVLEVVQDTGSPRPRNASSNIWATPAKSHSSLMWHIFTHHSGLSGSRTQRWRLWTDTDETLHKHSTAAKKAVLCCTHSVRVHALISRYNVISLVRRCVIYSCALTQPALRSLRHAALTIQRNVTWETVCFPRERISQWSFPIFQIQVHGFIFL